MSYTVTQQSNQAFNWAPYREAYKRDGARSVEGATYLVASVTHNLPFSACQEAGRRMVEHGECAWHAAAVVTGQPCIAQCCRPDIRRYC